MNRMIKRLLAAVLITSMLLGSNGISYAAEIADGDSIAGTEEVTQEAVDEEQVESPGDAEASEPANEESAEEEQIQEEAGEGQEADAQTVEEAGAEASEEENTAAEEEISEAASEEEAVESEDEDAAVTEEAAAAEDAEAPENADAAAAELTAEEAAAAAQAQEEVFTAGELVYHGADYDVTLAYDENAKIPATAELKVREIAKGTSEYESYLAGAEAAAGKGVAEARFFDITIVAAGTDGQQQEIQPQSQVRVNITYHKALEVAAEGEVQAMHFEDGTADAEVVNTDTNGGSEVSEIAFDAESFSVYGIVYTVDFTYDGFTYSMPGEGSIYLSELAEILGLYETDLDKAFSVGNVSDVKFTNYELINIEQQADGDWLLTSLASFTSEETLTITMVDGTKFVVVVTDPPEETGSTQISSDLSNFLTAVLITGATQNSEGRYEVEQGKDYSLIAKFEENGDYQFQNEAELTYQMPEGIRVIHEQNGPLKINIVYKGKTYEVDASFNLTEGGKLTVKFDESDPEYPKLVSATNVSFRFTYEAQFDGTATEIIFNDDVERDIVFTEPEPGQAFADKTAVYDESTGTFNYTIKVRATGDVTKVNVRDVITGDALIFNSDVIVSGNSSDYTDNGAQNGFDYTFASMREGEEITITYSAKVNFAKDADKDGKINADQTKNTVIVKPEDGEPHKSDYSHEIAFNSTKKSDTGTEEGTTENGDKIIGWTIDYNRLAVAPAAGYTITDTIAAGSADYMKYYGDGITVMLYDHDNKPVGSYTVPYASMTSHSDSSWKYTIPADHTEPYHYVITYQTVVDMEKVNGAGSAVHLTNTANGDHGAVDVTPGNKVGITKQVVQSSTQEISWVSEIRVPDGGLDVAVVTDTLPTIWSGNIGKSGNYSLYDLLKGDVEITGLVGDESYTLDTSGEDKVVITFYKDSNKSIQGLTAVEGGHTIIVRLTTTVNQEWLEAGYDYPTTYQSYHQNTIDINGTTATAGVRFVEEDMAKTASDLGNGVYKYTIKLSNVSESPIIIDDVFDTTLLEVDLSKESTDWNKEVFYISGGSDVNHIYTGEKSEKVNYTETESGIRITANTVPMQEDGQYYPAYMITYFLKLKDGVDLEQLAIANGGTHELTNTANWNGHESSHTFETVYEYLDKKLLNEGELGGTNREARYQITFNSAKGILNGGEPMEMKDTLSANLSVDYSSVTIVTDPAGASVPYSFAGGQEGTTVATYTVPDATKVTITYKANVAGNDKQKIVNKVEVNGRDKTVENENDYGAVGEGDGAIAAFKIVKVDGYDANKKLSGVKFKLYPSISGRYFDKNNTISELIFTTDENGEIIIDGDATIGDDDEKIQLFFNEMYYLQEIEGPDDYAKITFPYNITLTNDMARVDYDHYVYYYSDTMQIKNWPLEGLIVEKQVESTEEADLTRRYNFRISILDENDDVDTAITRKIGDDDFVEGVTEFDLKTGEQKMFWGFDKGTKYKVEEIDADGFVTTVTYSVYDEEGNVTDVKTEKTTEHAGELTQDDETIVFKNTKTDFGSLKIKKNVTVNGAATTGTEADGDYSFVVKDATGTTVASKTITITNGESNEIQVDDLVPGTYTVSEVTDSNPDGMSLVGGNDLSITVTANNTANIPVAEFTNNKTEVGSLKITKKVTVNGEATTGTSADGTYTFTVTDENGEVKATETITITNGESNEIQVDDLVPGTYTVSEVTGSNPDGMSLVGGNDLSITVTANNTANIPVAEFTNNKTEVGSLKIKKNVTVNGAATTGTSADGTYTFTVKDESGEVKATETITITGGVSGEVQVDNLVPGTYTVSEVTDSNPDGMSLVGGNDLSITVTANNTANIPVAEFTNNKTEVGSLKITKNVTGTTAKDKVFTFEITLTTESGVTLAESYPALLDGQETSNATVESGKVTVTLTAGQSYEILELPARTEYSVVEVEAKIPEGYSQGTHQNYSGTIAINSVVSALMSNKYESSTSIDFNITKNLDGRPISNSVNDKEGRFAFGLYIFHPVLRGANAELRENWERVGDYVFCDNTGIATFSHEDENFKNVLTFTQNDITDWNNDGTGTGTKVFKVAEYIPDDAVNADGVKYEEADAEQREAGGFKKDGYTYDSSVKTVTVNLVDDGKGKITATVEEEPDELKFTNNYAAEGEIVLHAQKKLSGARKLEEGQFTFELIEVIEKDDSEVEKVIDTKKNDAKGTVTFDPIKYTQEDIYDVDEDGVYSGSGEKEFTYKIREVIPKGAVDNGDGTYFFEGYTYDGNVYTIKVTATDNGDGTITAVDAADKATDGQKPTEEKYVFVNAYDAVGGLKLNAEKTYKNGTLRGGEFTFELRDADGKVLQSRKNDAAGHVYFEPLDYELEDAAKSPFTYTVREVPGSRTDVKYDATVYTVTVSLEDNGDGTLKVTKKIDNGGALKFVNEQLNVETSVTIGGEKVLKGGTLKNGQFKFVLADANGKWVDTATNDAEGNFTFKPITYKLSDLNGEKAKVFTYGVSEVKGSESRITYDEKVYTVKVTVTDNGDGTMTAKADLAKSDIKFVNREEKKKKDNTKTGDEAPLGVLFGGLGIGAAGLAVLLEDRKRRNRNKK